MTTTALNHRAPASPSPNELEPEMETAKEKRKLPSKASRQRFKPQLSCTFCRGRKLKCDRNSPCENCIKRDQTSSCTYVHGSLRDKSAPVQKVGSPQKDPRDVQSRVRHLEELVVSLMHGRSSAGTSPQSHFPAGTESAGLSDPDTPDSFGRISIEDEQTSYVGAGHWAAILDSISGLKESLEDSNTSLELSQPSPQDAQGIELLTGSIPRASKAEILAALPPRDVTDRLMIRIYSTTECVPCIHLPTFKKQYDSFWATPFDTPILWIGLLYSHLCFVLYLETADAFTGPSSFLDQPLPDPHSTIQIFRDKIVQCLVLGNYTEPTAYTVETLIMYFFTEHFRPSSSPIAAWMLVGIIARSAMRLGYHRDARHFPRISILQGEMQRRIWATVAHLDLQSSCRVGLPRMVKEGMFDTEPPRNLLDDDMDEFTKVLPPSRPWDDITPSTHSLLKHAITRVYGMIVDVTGSTCSISYEEVMRLDSLLEEAYRQVPEHLKVRDMEDLKIGTPLVVLQRFALSLAYQRARCLLHRKFVTMEKSASAWKYPYSVKACIDAAMRILHSQAYIYEETKPHRSLYGHKWRTSSLVTHDFLLAAMVICVHFNNDVNQEKFWVAPGQERSLNHWSRNEVLDALETAYRIWIEASRSSKDALKAAKALRATLSKFRGAKMLDSHSPPSQILSSSYERSVPSLRSCYGANNGDRNVTAQNIEIPTSAVSYDTSSWPLGSFQTPSPDQVAEQSYGESPFGGFENVNNPSLEFDWETWDNHFHNNLPHFWASDAGTFAYSDSDDNVIEWVQ